MERIAGGKGGLSLSNESFEKLLLTHLHEVFDPSTDLLNKSKKLGLMASNSLGFAH